MSLQFEVVDQTRFLSAMQQWQQQGYNLMTAIRLLDSADGGLVIGLSDIDDQNKVLLSENLNQSFPNCQAAFAELGRMFDAYFAQGSQA